MLAIAKEKAKKELLEFYAGLHIQEFKALYKEMERRGKRQKAAWFVNIAFMKEDFQTDPEFLNLVFQRMSGVPGPLLSNAASVAEATADTFEKTNAVALEVLETYIDVQSGKIYKEVWEGVIEILYRIAREQNFNAFRDLKNETYDWLDEFSFKTNDKDYDSRFANFVGLMASFEGVTSLRGPTARMLRQSMKLSDSVDDDGTGSINITDFHPVNNALQLTKLGFLSEKGIKNLGEKAGLTKPLVFDQSIFHRVPKTHHEVSEICKNTPHIVCDAIQSLDDPNNYGEGMPDDAEYGNVRNKIDVERSVLSWKSRRQAHGPSKCRIGGTNFLLSANREVYDQVYAKIFMLPEHCK